MSQFQLRAISLCGIVLVLIWALSPIGGQASIRQIAIGVKSTTQTASFDYFVHHGYANGFQSIGTSRTSLWQIVNTIFTGGIIGALASKSSPVDTWGNVKVPRIEYHESRTEPDSEGWFKTANGSLDSYSSLIGIPISGTNSTQFLNYNTTIQTPYFRTECSLTKSPDGVDRIVKVPEGMVNYTGTGAIIMFENFTQMSRAFSDPESLKPLQFRYMTQLWSQNNHELTCNLTSSFVETEVFCQQRTSCTATRVRRSKISHPRSEWTQLDLQPTAAGVVFLQLLSSVSGKVGWPTMLDRYMSDPDTVITLGENVHSTPLTTEENYSVRFAQLLNYHGRNVHDRRRP